MTSAIGNFSNAYSYSGAIGAAAADSGSAVFRARRRKTNGGRTLPDRRLNKKAPAAKATGVKSFQITKITACGK